LLVPVLEPPMPPGAVLDPPGAVVDEPLPREPLPVVPLDVPLDVPPAPLERPCSCRQRSFSAPISASQRDTPVLAPVEEEPLTPLDDEPVLLPLEPTDGVVALLPLPRLPDPVLLPEVCANAPDMAKSAAAVAETMSFSFMEAPFGW
jgi:hypothetical protein